MTSRLLGVVVIRSADVSFDASVEGSGVRDVPEGGGGETVDTEFIALSLVGLHSAPEDNELSNGLFDVRGV